MKQHRGRLALAIVRVAGTSRTTSGRQRMQSSPAHWRVLMHAHEKSVVVQGADEQLRVAARAAVRGGRRVRVRPGQPGARQRHLHLDRTRGPLACAGGPGFSMRAAGTLVSLLPQEGGPLLHHRRT